MKWWQYILFGVALCVMVAVGFLIGRHCRIESPQGAFVVRVDTLLIRDTITQTRPIYVNRQKIDTIMVQIRDTAVVHDTAFVVLDKELVEWRDSLCIVYASGIRVNVDSVRHYVERQIITQQVPVKVRTRWGVGIQAGYGVGVAGGRVTGVPYIGVGVSYNLLSW